MSKNQDDLESSVLKTLFDYIAKYAEGGIALAFSGGADSTFLLDILVKAQKHFSFKLLALIVSSDFHPKSDIDRAVATAKEYGVSYRVLPFSPLNIPEVQSNYPNRCYYCKIEMFRSIVDAARAEHLSVVFDDTNIDDEATRQSGWRALKEMRILSPLADLNFTKTVIKYTASSLGLRCATQPSTTCFASRFEPNVVITREKIERVAEGEAFLRRFLPEEADLRLRVHDNIARIKVQPEYFSFLLEQRQRILDLLNALGFRYVTLDLAGF